LTTHKKFIKIAFLFQAQAEANAESAAQKVASQDKILAEEIDKLEEKKLNDMKVRTVPSFNSSKLIVKIEIY
jgi:hypothetical protein